MNKIIWTCWFQGRENAPELVKKCISSWELKNPDWDVRCLDAATIPHYIGLDDYIDLHTQTITAASVSDILRILLLHEFGGVWVDSTLYCNHPLSTWLPSKLHTGFFAFSNPGPDRMLASWFLASAPNNSIVSEWAKKVITYWDNRTNSRDYFWFHHLFTELYSADPHIRANWEGTPKISADGPHSILKAGMLQSLHKVQDKVKWSSPLFKLTYRVDQASIRSDTLLYHLMQQADINKIMDDKECFRRHGSSKKYKLITRLLDGNGYSDHYAFIASPKYIRGPTQSCILVISDDEKIRDYLPEYIKQKNSPRPLSINVDSKSCLTDSTFKQASLVVTTFQDCALAAIAKGISVVLFYSPNLQNKEIEDYYLTEFIRVFSIYEVNKVDWQGYCPDISFLKLQIIDNLSDDLKQHKKPIGPFASPDKLPIPSLENIKSLMSSSERVMRINKLRIPDRERWASPLSYETQWNKRGELAAQMIPDGVNIFEIGTGLGWFRSLVSDRCNYNGADLVPLDSQTLTLDLDHDGVPAAANKGYIVLLGVFEHLHRPLQAANKLLMADNLIMSYYCRTTNDKSASLKRRSLGWANHFSEDEFLDIFTSHSFKVNERVIVSYAADYQQVLVKLSKQR